MEDTDRKFPTNKTVFVVALTVAVAVVVWAAVAPGSISVVGADMQEWITTHFAWLLGGLMIAVLLFMLIVGYGPTGNIKLGADDSRPDYSTGSWIAMLFAAGLGIGLVFYGPLEPLTHLLDPTPATDAKAGTMAAVLPSMSTTILHQASLAWAIYAFVGGAIAYSSYRRGRLPLISSIFEPVFPNGTHKILGGIIDIFAVLVTLFGTAISLGIGALQIRTGTSLLTGKEIHGNAFLIGAMVLLTGVFIFSAVSGIKRGIRMLSNANMVIVVALAAFALLTGPTLFILDLFPTSIYALFHNFTEPRRLRERILDLVDHDVLGMVGVLVAIRRNVYCENFQRANAAPVHHCGDFCPRAHFHRVVHDLWWHCHVDEYERPWSRR